MKSYDLAFKTWSNYSEYVEDSVHLTHEGHSYLTKLPRLLEILESDEEELASARFRADRAKREIDDSFWMLHSHSLLGLWSALETLVGDVFVGRVIDQPELLQKEEFRKYRLPPAAFSSGDMRKVASALLEVVWASGGGGSAPGRFERLLKLVGLDGAVPSKVSRELNRAHGIRNLCAHRGGVVDRRFLDDFPNDKGQLGERVALAMPDFSPLMHSTHMYSITILNRILAEEGRPKINAECRGFEGAFEEQAS